MHPVTLHELETQLAEELPRRELMGGCNGNGGGNRQTNNNAALIQLVNFQVNQSG